MSFQEDKLTGERPTGAGAVSEATSTIKSAAADATEAVQGVVRKAKDLVQDAAARGAQSASDTATEGYRVASDVAQRGYKRGRELVSEAPSPADAIASHPLFAISVAALAGGVVGWMLRGSQDR